MQISDNMKISDLYKKSTMGEELKKFFTALIEYENIKQTLREPNSYDGKKLRMTEIQNFMMILSKIMSKFSIGVDIGYVNSSLVSPLGQNLIKHPDKKAAEVIDMTIQECTSVKLKDMLKCSDFINVFNRPKNETKSQLQDLLIQHAAMSYDDVKKAVDSSSLSPENKKIFFAKVLPAYDFKVCNNFQATWDMFKKGYIDFDTLVTKFWKRDDFDKGQNNTVQKNAFQNFAYEYSRCLNNNENALGGLVTSANGMNGMNVVLKNQDVIIGNEVENLKNQIGKATDVTIFGVIIQFFANLFSKGKIARKANFKLEQDRAISNLKPLSGLLRQATTRHREER